MAVTVESSGLSQYGWQVGIFCGISCIISTLILNKIKGDFSRLEGFFALKKWEFIENSPKVELYAKAFKYLVIFMISWPMWALLSWGIAVLVAAEERGESQLPGTSILLIGMSIFSFILGVMFVKFNNFRFTKISLLCFVVGILCFFAFQLVALLMESTVSFFGISATFLTINAMIMLVIIQMLQAKQGCTILEIIENREIVERGRSLTKEDCEDLEKLIKDEEEDENYKPTDEEIFSLFTLVNQNDKGDEIFEIEEKLKMVKGTSLGGGIMDSFKRSSGKKKVAKIVSLYAIAIGVLIAYSIVGYNYCVTSEQYLSAITTVAVILTDIIVYFLISCKLTNGVIQITVLMLGFRAFLFGFGGDLWFLGYCCVYLFLGIFLSQNIVNRRYPYNEVHSEKKLRCIDRIKTPEFVQFIALFLLVVLSAILQGADFERIPTEGVNMFDKTYDFYIFGVAAIFLNASIFCYLMALRIYNRKLKGIKDYKTYNLFCKWFTPYYMFLSLFYLLIVALGIVWYALAEELFILFSCLILPLVYESIMLLYFNWQLNDYKIIADISAYNDKMKRFQELRQKQKEKRIQIQKELQEKMGKQQQIDDTTVEQTQQNNPKDSVNDMLDELGGNDQSLQKKQSVKQQEVQLFMGAGSATDVMSLKQNFTTYHDWKLDGISFWEALKTGKLLKSDYNTLIAIGVMILLLIIYSACVGSTSSHFPLLGVTISVSILTILCTYLPLKQYFATLNKPNLQQILLAVFGFLINFGWGAYYYSNKYDEDQDKGNDPQYYLTYFVFLLPWSIFFTTFWKKWKDDKFKFGKVSVIALILSFIFAMGSGIQFILGKSVPAGLAIVGFWFFVYFGLFMFYIYKKNNDSLPRKFLYLALIIILFVCVSSLVVSLFLDSFNDFLGFSITYLVLTLLLLIYSTQQLISDFNNQHKEPLFASPWVFPIYKYNSDQGVINKNTRPFSLFFLSCILVLAWSIAVTIWVHPTSIGTSLCNLALCFIYIIIITISSWSLVALGEAKEKINPELIKTCWLSAKREYLKGENATSNDQVITYQDKKRETKSSYSEIQDVKQAYSSQDNDYFLDLRDRYEEYYNSEQQQYLQFYDEVKLLIHFQLMIVLKCDTHKRREMKKFINFIQSWQADLQILGIIFIQSGSSKRIEDVYDNYRTQYDNLTQDHQKKVDKLFDEYEQEKKDEDKKDEQRSEEEEQKRLQREEELRKRMEQREKDEEIDWNQDLDQIQDCPEKYLKILQNFRANKQKYEDSNFKCDGTTLTDQSRNSCSSWQRPPEGSELIKNGYSPMDMRQGMCGNCYFLSAVSVIGEKNFNQVLLLDDEKLNEYQEERKQCGAYIVRFFYAGEPQYVIIDDRLPMTKAGSGETFLYASSEDENEIWPQIIEKAYAKHYGGYGNIEGGKVAYAVMELTGGQPEEIELKQFQDNTEQFWNDLLNYQKMGYIMGAGSPAHEMGDRAVSEEGIVQGHAYSVLQIKDMDGNQLIQLRNPHGNESAEWTGDWGDRSYLWNDRMKKLSGNVFGNDGMFWMSVEDFVYEYRALYVCRTFPKDIWTEIPKISSGWIGKRAAGLPTKKHPKAQMHENPHYGITVSKKANLYVSLTILDKDPEDVKYGKYPIYFMCQRNEGERIRGRSSDKMVGQSGMPIALTTVTNELNLKASSYPYTFSLMLATTEKGGEAMYSLQMWCSDKNVKIKDDADIQ